MNTPSIRLGVCFGDIPGNQFLNVDYPFDGTPEGFDAAWEQLRVRYHEKARASSRPCGYEGPWVGEQEQSLEATETVASVKVGVYCGAYFGPPRPPEGEPAECGWETTIEVDAVDWDDGTVLLACERCGTELGRDDMALTQGAHVMRVDCSQFASCQWHGKRLVEKLGVQPKPCPKCGKEVVA